MICAMFSLINGHSFENACFAAPPPSAKKILMLRLNERRNKKMFQLCLDVWSKAKQAKLSLRCSNVYKLILRWHCCHNLRFIHIQIEFVVLNGHIPLAYYLFRIKVVEAAAKCVGMQFSFMRKTRATEFDCQWETIGMKC